MITDEGAARRWVEALPGCDQRARDRLELFAAMLLAENQAQNLVATASLDSIWQRHIADSGQLLQFAPPISSPWLDLGSGAGFPGIVVAILRPEIAMVLVESRKLRSQWLQRAVAALELANTRVVMGRMEKVPSFAAGVISGRAFAPLQRILDLAARFSTSETLWLLPKGRSARHELAELRGWSHMFHVEPSQTDSDAGVIVGRLIGREGRHA